MFHPWSYYINEKYHINQKFTENIFDYANRIYKDGWHLLKKGIDKEEIVSDFGSEDKFFIEVFICHLFNANVRQQMYRWYDDSKWYAPKIPEVVFKTNDYQNEQDKKILQEFPITFNDEQLNHLLNQIDNTTLFISKDLEGPF